MYCLSKQSGQPVARSITKANCFKDRLIGLLGTKSMRIDQGLLIEPCTSIHTIGMSFPIDVVFMDCHWVVTAIFTNVPPCRIKLSPKNTKCVLELFGGVAVHTNIQVGDKLHCEEIEGTRNE